MQKVIYILLLLMKFEIAHGQRNEMEKVLNGDRLLADHFKKSDLKANQLFLESPFARAELDTTAGFEQIKHYVIYRVDLVYTTYKESETFSQHDLNYKRMVNLKKIAPQLFNNGLIAWGQIAITGAKSSVEGKEMFHGFVLTYREPSTRRSREDEITFIKELLSDTVTKKMERTDESVPKVKLPVYKKRFYDEIALPEFEGGDSALNAYLNKHVKYPKDALRNHKEGQVEVSFIVSSRGEVQKVSLVSGIDLECNNEAMEAIARMPKWKPGKRNGNNAAMRYTLPVTFTLADKSVKSGDSLRTGTLREYKPRGRHEELITDSVDAPPAYYKFMKEQDSSVFKILNRNNWKNTLFVCDVTGSMSPYTSQLLLWYKLNLTRDLVKHFFFFNDGDNKSDLSKETGKTGGIYHAAGNDFNMVAETLYQAMTNGSGGDTPENNIEAVTTALQQYPEYDNVVMIADNFATPRDLVLLHKVTKPVKVILCGTYAGINTDYMDMVRKNKGSLHTIEEDINNLVNLNEGEEVSIEGHTYKVKNGRFEYVVKL